MRYILFISLLFLFSCELFTTREPEKPDKGGSTYLPPTSYDVVVTNLKSSLVSRNISNYLKSFSDSSETELPNFRYIPDGQNYSQNKSIFDNWDMRSEEKYFSSMTSSIIEETTPSINFVNEEFQSFNDSIIYSAEYFLDFEFTNDLADNTYTGNMRLVLKDTDTGFWYITSWYDFVKENQDNSYTWSFLRSKYFF